MSVETLANAAVQLSKASKLEAGLQEALAKWVAKALKPLLTPGMLSALIRNTSAATVEVLLNTATSTDLKKLAKSLDPHNSAVGAKTPATLTAHIVGLVTGAISAVPEPLKPERPAKAAKRRAGAKAPPADPSMIRSVSSRAEREALAQSLTIPKLKSYIKAEQLRPAAIQPGWGKPDLVRHILDELDAAEASGPRLLANSKYGAFAASRR